MLQFLYSITTCQKACKSFYSLNPQEKSDIFHVTPSEEIAPHHLLITDKNEDLQKNTEI